MMILREQIKIAKPSQRDNNDKNQRAIVGRDIKNRMEEAITEPNIEGDPTRSDE